MDSENRYVTWDVGARELGVTKGVFFYEVHQGRIKEDGSRAERDGKYLWSSILARKEERRKKHRRPYSQRQEPVHYGWIRPVDIPTVLQLDVARYENTEMEINYQEVGEYQRQVKRNPHIALAAWTIDHKECLGYISLVPVASERVALDIMAGYRPEDSLRLDEIEAYDRPGGYVLLCRSVVAKEGHGSVLTGILRGIMAYWVEQFPARYIQRVYAQAASDEGVRMIRHLFLMPMAGYPDNAYYLDFARFNPSRLIRDFLAAMEAKAPLPEILTQRYTPPLPAHPRMDPGPALSPLALPRYESPRAVVTRREAWDTSQEMPSGWVGSAMFARAHFPPAPSLDPEAQKRHFGRIDTMALRACERDPLLGAHEGHYRSGHGVARFAFGAPEQRRFWGLYHAAPGFAACPQCPHGE